MPDYPAILFSWASSTTGAKESYVLAVELLGVLLFFAGAIAAIYDRRVMRWVGTDEGDSRERKKFEANCGARFGDPSVLTPQAASWFNQNQTSSSLLAWLSRRLGSYQRQRYAQHHIILNCMNRISQCPRGVE